MKRLVLITFFLALTEGVLAHPSECVKWEYASLSFTSNAVIVDNEYQSTYTFVLWEAPSGFGIWQNNQRQSGSIKTSLTEHFDIKEAHAPSILNAIGENGWEAYGFHAIQESNTAQTKQWQLKRCTG